MVLDGHRARWCVCSCWKIRLRVARRVNASVLRRYNDPTIDWVFVLYVCWGYVLIGFWSALDVERVFYGVVVVIYELYRCLLSIVFINCMLICRLQSVVECMSIIVFLNSYLKKNGFCIKILLSHNKYRSKWLYDYINDSFCSVCYI